MHCRNWGAIASAAVLGTFIASASAFAGYGAIAWDKATGKQGWSWNQSTARKAAEGAISQCGASGCRLVIRPTTLCAALASTEDGKFIGAAARKDKDAARLAALSDCKKGKAGDCVVRVSDCSK